MANAADENDYDCSDAFTLLASADAPTVGDDGYYLEVTSPSTGDVAMAGQYYTIEVSACVKKTEQAFKHPRKHGSSTERKGGCCGMWSLPHHPRFCLRCRESNLNEASLSETPHELGHFEGRCCGCSAPLSQVLFLLAAALLVLMIFMCFVSKQSATCKVSGS